MDISQTLKQSSTTHAEHKCSEHGLHEAKGPTSDYWRTPQGISRRIEMLSQSLTYQVVNNSLMFYGNSVGVQWVRWNTQLDERVCFPAGTQITTLHGERPIEDIQPGEQVLTRKGYKKVIATTSRPYTGRMVTIEHEAGRLTSTENHPVWKVGAGWLDAIQIKPGDFLNTVDNKHSRVLGVLQFTPTNPDNVPPFTKEILGLPIVPSPVPMPVIPIDFQRHPKLLEQKIYTVPTHPSLLNILNIERIKDFTNRLFQQGLALILTIARKTTELTVRISRQSSKLLSTIPAVNKFGWASTNLTTIMPIQTLLSPENFTTTLTGDIFGLSRSTLPTTNRISIRNGAINLKGLTTLWANLLNLIGCTRSKSTFPRTKLFPPFNSTGQQVELSTTLGADTPFSTSFPLGRLGLHKLMMNGHNNHLLLPNYIKVFNLEVEDKPEYYANGVLVHNCPICGPLEGNTISPSLTGRPWYESYPLSLFWS